MRIVLSGGGTAGHINPALALADVLRERGHEVLFAGTPGGIESRLVPAAGIPYKAFEAAGFNRNHPLTLPKAIMKIQRSTKLARKWFSEVHPDCVVGFGGYVCIPVARAAEQCGIPVVVHEQNSVMGMANKYLARRARAVCLTYDHAAQALSDKSHVVLTGNPVRVSVLQAEREAARKALNLDDRPLVLSFGGSLGAVALNKAAAYMLGESVKEKKYQHIHGYGQHDEKFLDEVHAAGVKEEENPQIRMLEYIDNMPECLAAADLVIGRAGAITLTEIEATGKCSILIPSPNVAENHQFHNAMALVNRDAAVMIEEKDLTGEKLWETVNTILSEPGRAEEIGKNAKAMAVLDANDRIYNIICEKAKK